MEEKQRERARKAAVLEYLVAVVLLALNAWLALGSFESVAHGAGSVEYVLVSTSVTALLACLAGAAGVLLGVQFKVRAGRSADALFSVETTHHLRPLRWLALSLIPLLALVLPFASRLAPLWYVLWDLRWYWWLLVVVESLKRARRTNVTSAAVPERSVAATVALVLIPLGMATVFTPHLRFSGVLHGDEPKYLRFCENFFQGVGFDISDKRPLAQASGPEYPKIQDNVRHFARAMREEFGLLLEDTRRLVTRSDSRRLLSAEPSPAMFFAGKHAGTVYQLHSPGISFVLFPAYLMDRMFTGSGVGYQQEFPATMPVVHVLVMALFAAYTLALYRVLYAYTRQRAQSWLLAVLGSTTLPASAFVFQIYPEVAAGLALFVLVRAVINPNGVILGAAVGYGVLSGCLPWLHVRFGLATVVIAGAMLVVYRREWRHVVGFALGATIPLLLLCLYTYRLTGSLLPVATYGSDAPLSLERMLKGVPAFAIDRVWGLFPHAPIYLLAVPGLAVAWRHRRSAAFMVLIVVASVVLPAAAHGFWAGGSTPGRYLVPVAPLLLLFVADAMGRWSKSNVGSAAFIALALVSVQTAVRYNLHHVKQVGPLVSHEFSGWRMNLLFPSLGTGVWTSEAIAGLCVWVAVLALSMGAVWRGCGKAETVTQGTVAHGRLTAVMISLGVLAVAGMVTSASGQSFDSTYLIPAKTARERALRMFAGLPDCAWCYSSRAGSVPPTTALGNEVGLIDLRVVDSRVKSGIPARIRVRPRTPAGKYLVGDLRLEFGDGTGAFYSRLFGDIVVTHAYHAPGEYIFRASVRTSTEHGMSETLQVMVEP